MPRLPREKSRNGTYHIILRGINRQTIFEDAEDKKQFLETLKKYKRKSQFKLYSYCIMDNHVHLLVKEGEEPISTVVKRISSSYVLWYNLKYERVGHLFQDRFKSETVDSVKSFLTVLRYIHQNPLKAGLAKSILECKWTSIHEYFKKSSIIDIDFGLGFFSGDRNLFLDFMQRPNDDQCLDDYVKIRMPDSVVIESLNQLGYTSSSLQQLEKTERDRILIKLKGLNGVSLRQLSRVTGISKNIIHRVR